MPASSRAVDSKWAIKRDLATAIVAAAATSARNFERILLADGDFCGGGCGGGVQAKRNNALNGHRAVKHNYHRRHEQQGKKAG